jgi:hypothetical protein
MPQQLAFERIAKGQPGAGSGTRSSTKAIKVEGFTEDDPSKSGGGGDEGPKLPELPRL